MQKSLLTYLFVFFATLQISISQNINVAIPDSTKNPFFEISKKESLKSGEVNFFQDQRIEDLVKNNISTETTIVNGFRVQVFSSNSHTTAKKDAFDIEQKLKKTYPNMAIYVSYSSPFWKVRVGDFLTQDEAKLFMDELINNLPKLRKETYIVRERISLSSKTY